MRSRSTYGVLFRVDLRQLKEALIPQVLPGDALVEHGSCLGGSLEFSGARLRAACERN